ncbi:hypothetical protein K435DRAFT_861896 [Dendrothele bispora CBS 962.96]|uniref:Uncharacterized protein n=1 Tax=Dendrothele bispora (strain CBS 962.96) TaxID=1314807 RepID=A0A4S8LUJ6_DENBC|nr:hypothetical protein K435DRAFT_861896 [Dendrothele bispora CBS 962.96]
MHSALKFTRRLHAFGSNLPCLTDEFLQSIHPPRTPLHVVSNDPAQRALYLMLTKIWPAKKLEDTFMCSMGTTHGCIIHHLLTINVHGQLKATCELCSINDSLPVLTVWEWAVLQDGLRRWEAQEDILRRTIDLAGECTPPIPTPYLVTTVLFPSSFDEGLKAIYNIIIYLHPERELLTAICPHSPAGCIAFHIVTVHPGGRLNAECDRCDVQSHCHPLNDNEYYQVQQAYLLWIDQDHEEMAEEMEKLRQEMLMLERVESGDHLVTIE